MPFSIARRRERADPDRPIRVAQVCGATDGALWMVQISAGLAARGYDVVAIIASADGGTAAALRKVGIPFEVAPQPLASTSRVAAFVGRIPYLGYLRFAIDAGAMLRTGGRIARILRRREVDVVHGQTFSSMLIGRLAGAMARVPLRVSMPAGPYHLEVPYFRIADVLTHRLDHLLLPGCQRTDDLYAEFGVAERRRRVVGYGVDPHGHDPAAADPARIRGELGIGPHVPLVGQVAFFYPVVTGRLAPPSISGRGVKGHEDFVEAARRVLERRPDARFLLVGDGWGPEGERHRDDIRRLVGDLRIEHAVTFLGRRSDVPDILAALDVSVQCSLSENYGGTLESLLMEAPTIATRVGGMPEAVRHEETGLLVEPSDPQALAAAMLRLIGDRELGRRLGRAGRELMLERHTIQHTIDAVDRVYRDALRERGVRRPPVGGVPPSTATRLPRLGPEDVLFSERA